jgi:hypothetical protein
MVTSPVDTEIVPPPTDQLVAELEASGWVIAYEARDEVSYEEARRAGCDFWFGTDSEGVEWWAAITPGAHALAALARLMPLTETQALALARCPSDRADERRRVGKRLVSHMRRLGWTGPRAMRIPPENGHAAGSSGYWRLPSHPRRPAMNVEGEVDGEVDAGLSDDLPAALEQVTRLGLKKLEKVLRVPLDPTDGNLVRSQVTAAIGAVNAQLRADEQQLRRKRTGDVMDRLLKLIEEEKKKLLPTSSWEVSAVQQPEHVELEPSEGSGED